MTSWLAAVSAWSEAPGESRGQATRTTMKRHCFKLVRAESMDVRGGRRPGTAYDTSRAAQAHSSELGAGQRGGGHGARRRASSRDYGALGSIVCQPGTARPLVS